MAAPEKEVLTLAQQVESKLQDYLFDGLGAKLEQIVRASDHLASQAETRGYEPWGKLRDAA